MEWLGQRSRELTLSTESWIEGRRRAPSRAQMGVRVSDDTGDGATDDRGRSALRVDECGPGRLSECADGMHILDDRRRRLRPHGHCRGRVARRRHGEVRRLVRRRPRERSCRRCRDRQGAVEAEGRRSSGGAHHGLARALSQSPVRARLFLRGVRRSEEGLRVLVRFAAALSRSTRTPVRGSGRPMRFPKSRSRIARLPRGHNCMARRAARSGEPRRRIRSAA